MLRALTLAASLAFAPLVLAQRPMAVVPTEANTVIERLPSGYAMLMPMTERGAAVPSLTQIHALLATAARTGDARLASRAEALLAGFPATAAGPRVLLARAYAAQHRHDFTTAARLLDSAVAQDPRAGDIRLARAQLNVVRGELRAARADCVPLALGIDQGDGLLCVALLALRKGRYATAATAVDRWLRQGVVHDGRRRYALLMRAEIAARAGDATAEQHFRRALAAAPDDVRTLAAYARHLRSTGRTREVEVLLARRPEHDGLQLQRLLAAQRHDPTTAAALMQALARRHRQARALGQPAELRDQAEFLLSVRHDPAAALALAQRNFAEQRDHEDVDLLVRAALAARRQDALRPLQAWAKAQGVPLPPIAGPRR